MQNYRPSLGIPPAVKILLILNAAMYFLSIFVKQSFHVDMANLLGLHLPQSFYWAPWQYITHMFMHGSFLICFSICSLSLCSDAYWNPYGEANVF